LRYVLTQFKKGIPHPVPPSVAAEPPIRAEAIAAGGDVSTK
jgi:hypothetical protein